MTNETDTNAPAGAPNAPGAVAPGLSTSEIRTATASRHRLALGLLLAAVFVVFLNETVMSVAIPSIQNDLEVLPSQGQWLTTAFALTMAVVIPITGWLLQRLNTRPVFVAAMSLFVLGTLIAAVSPSFEVLLLGRVVQASGTAIMMPLMMTTILTVVPLNERGRFMGRISIVMSLAPAIGPTISGLLLQIMPWRGLFWVMLPIAAVVLLIGALRVPNVSEPRKAPLDVLSVFLSAIAFSGVVYGLSSIGEVAQGAALVQPWVPLVVGIVFLGLFITRQILLQKRDASLLDLRTFKSRTFSLSIAMLAIGMISLFGMIILLPSYIQYGLRLEPAVIGLTLLPGGLLMGLLGPLVGRLLDKFGPRPLVIPASILISGVFWALTLLTEETPIWVVVALHIGLSLGMAFMFTPLFTTGLGALPRHLYSHGSATVATIQQVAGAAGTAMFVAFFSIGLAAAGAVGEAKLASPSQIADGVHLAFTAGAIVTLLVIVLSFFIRREDAPEDAPAP
ncbi:MAG TPA: DHA2 family efflux MFS transporter permease subunit [Pseudolysinimonas sp.]|nr:DHA2 family efflux MFS transporter permease subunit [Pseudolysinimonas sp.]